jgi:hypothetical protein
MGALGAAQTQKPVREDENVTVGPENTIFSAKNSESTCTYICPTSYALEGPSQEQL